MTDNQKRILGAIAFVIATIVIAILLFLMFFGSSQEEAVPVVDETGAVTADTVGGFDLGTSPSRSIGSTLQQTPEPVQEPAPEPVQDDQGDISRIAAAFAERYGSFSSNSDFANLLDLKTFMTQDLAGWADGYIEDAMAAERSAVSFGVTTRALIITVDSLDTEAGTAEVTVKTQRSERSGGSVDSRIYYQDLAFDFLKIGDVWKVDSVAWQEEDEEL